MLKYKVNSNNIIKPYTEMVPLSFSIDDLGYEDFYICRIVHDGKNNFEVGDIIEISHTTFNDNAEVRDTVYTNKIITYTIRTVDNISHSFTISVPKKQKLYAEQINLIFDAEKPSFLIKFNSQHYFDYGNECRLTFKLLDIGIAEKTIELICDFVDNYTVLWHYDEKVKNADVFADFLVNRCFYTKVDGDYVKSGFVNMDEIPEIAFYTSPDYIRISGINSKYDVYEKNYGIASVPKEPFLRDNFYFLEGDDVVVRVIGSTAQVSFGISQEFSADTYKEGLIRENFIKDEESVFFNDGQSLEKDIYHPVLIDSNGKSREIKKINFNLHFRKHDIKDNWKTIEEMFWNGTNDSSPMYPLISSCAYWNYPLNTRFSVEEISKRSDLLSKLGFNDSDVKYQKSRLKKSFLRLSYYDSENPVTQNLLAYYTIFFDTGKLLAKFIKHSNDKNYYNPHDDNSIYNTAISESMLDVGISTNKEPYNLNGVEDDEELRLSSQFSVSGRFGSKTSSDGFYLYLYRSYSTPFPEDAYLKIEFNHAGYGRKVPLFMPSYIFQRDYVKGVKSYEDILHDWQSNAGGYGFRQYNAYSYIHIKHRYDYDLKKHVFYMDPEYYGNSAIFENVNSGNGVLDINLYEPKVRI